jgi:uncharacterized protein (DUF362 family)
VKIVKALIDTLIEENPYLVVKIVESDSSGKWLDKAFRNNGYDELIEKYQDIGCDIELINLSKEECITLEMKSKPFLNLQIPKILLGRHFYISVARAKIHELTDITGILKNQFGCLSRKDKSVYHRYIDSIILEVNRWIKPDLCLVDAITGMEGVTKGRIVHIGVFICGKDPVAVDSTLSRVMGLDPYNIQHIISANKYGLGSINPKIVGCSINDVSVKLRRPNTIVKLMNRYIPEIIRPVASGVYQKINHH